MFVISLKIVDIVGDGGIRVKTCRTKEMPRSHSAVQLLSGKGFTSELNAVIKTFLQMAPSNEE